MDTQGLEKRLTRLRSDILELKTNQSIGGDSWIVYRHDIVFTKTAGSINVITFTPDVAGDFVTKAVANNGDRSLTGTDLDLMPDPNVKGKWYDCTYAFGPVTRVIMLYSTRKGSIKFENYTAPISA